jgi:hypothetical protein
VWADAVRIFNDLFGQLAVDGSAKPVHRLTYSFPILPAKLPSGGASITLGCEAFASLRINLTLSQKLE